MVILECPTTNSNNGIKGTYQEHKPCGYMLNVVSRIDNTCQPYLYRGEDCMKHFVEKLTEIKKIYDCLEEHCGIPPLNPYSIISYIWLM